MASERDRFKGKDINELKTTLDRYVNDIKDSFLNVTKKEMKILQKRLANDPGLALYGIPAKLKYSNDDILDLFESFSLFNVPSVGGDEEYSETFLIHKMIVMCLHNLDVDEVKKYQSEYDYVEDFKMFGKIYQNFINKWLIETDEYKKAQEKLRNREAELRDAPDLLDQKQGELDQTIEELDQAGVRVETELGDVALLNTILVEDIKKMSKSADNSRAAYVAQMKRELDKTQQLEKAKGGREIVKTTIQQDKAVSNALAEANNVSIEYYTRLVNTQERHIAYLRDVLTQYLLPCEIQVDENDIETVSWVRESTECGNRLKMAIDHTTNMLVDTIRHHMTMALTSELLESSTSLLKELKQTSFALHKALDNILIEVDKNKPRIVSGSNMNHEQRCSPHDGRIVSDHARVYDCWDGYTSKNKLRGLMRTMGYDTVTIVCCDMHKRELELIRQIRVVGYTMVYGEYRGRTWTMRIKNGG